MQHKEEPRWLRAPANLNLPTPFLRGDPVRVIGDSLEFLAHTENGKISITTPLHETFEMSHDALYADMCEMSILNEPQVLHNLIERYRQDEIFTYIGPTLTVINPYRLLEKQFSQKVLNESRDLILSGDLKDTRPHVYMIAGKAYRALVEGDSKQAIIISGQSGAGKTEQTKYCMQIIAALSHRESHQIEKRILACNPLLEAFGNSKTVRNDNSSRFGKYVQIFFGQDNTIQGANIISYLLEKSRVVSIAQRERSFHAFYALAAAGKYATAEAGSYQYLRQSGCFKIANIDDSKYFTEITNSMTEIGFTGDEQDRIWRMVNSVLALGNLQFTDGKHLINQSEPCEITNGNLLASIAQNLKVDIKHLEKILLFEKKIILKEVSYKAYNRAGCIANRNTLSKAVYNSVFEFIVWKIDQSLHPSQPTLCKSINILDIFGFENFQINSFEQLCINFTNQKLLKQYNKYIFENEMEILRDDGLEKKISGIRAPTNDDVISLISGKLSIFSIINDNTTSQQYKDEDIIHSFQRDLKAKELLRFDKLCKNKFTILHSQCEVCYTIDGFRIKNQDKVNTEIEEIYTRLFLNQNKVVQGKTLLHKFSKEIDDLVNELGSSRNHFIRCIKPNEKKLPKLPEPTYILTQVRYLGVFETIQIRKKTFPVRKTLEDFCRAYRVMFPNVKGKENVSVIQQIMAQLKVPEKQYLMGNRRVYLSKEIQDKLNQEAFVFFKVKSEKVVKIQKAYRKWHFRKTIFTALKTLVRRKKIWLKFATEQSKKIKARALSQIKQYATYKKKMLQDMKRQKQLQKRQKEENERRLMEQASRKKQDEQKKLQVRKKKEEDEKMQMKMKEALEKETKSVQQIRHNHHEVPNTHDYLNETMIAEDCDPQSPLKQVHRKKQQSPDYKKEHHFNQSFLDQSSIMMSSSHNAVFTKTTIIGKFNPEKGHLKKLQCILAEQYKMEITGIEEEFFSPNSQDCNFKVEDTPQQMFNQIVCFASQDFFNHVLRKRTTFIGMKKGFSEILVAKSSPLTKSLTMLNEPDQQRALKIFKVFVRISEQAKLDNVFKLIENMISLCQSTSQQLKNEIFLQLIKQANTSNELAAIRIFQSMAVFLHIYTPDSDFLLAGLNLYFQKLNEEKHSDKEGEYIRYLFKKMLRKIDNPPIIGYMPIKYQMMALMCKRQISVPIYLPIGNSVLIRVQSNDTFSDIKQQVIELFGINMQRLKPYMFRFFEIVNFENEELEESPINQSQIVWDIMTYWELAKEKYKETNTNPPAFFIMLKLIYAFECLPDDIEGVELCFAQCYFDYFIGRIKLDLDLMGVLAGCVKKIKLSNRRTVQVLDSYPTWMANTYDKQMLTNLMTGTVEKLQSEGLSTLSIKYKFLELCSRCPLAMAMAIPADTIYKAIKIFFKPRRIYMTEKGVILEEYSLSSISKWSIDKEKFVFNIKSKNGVTESGSHVIFTEFASVCSQFLSGLTRKQ